MRQRSISETSAPALATLPEAASPSEPVATAPQATTAADRLEAAPPSLRRSDRQPLDAAFAPPRVVSTLDERTERSVLASGGPALVAYGRFDPDARPVVLVHGINSGGEIMVPLADKLTAAGRQVYVFAYDDLGDRTSVSGVHLARALTELRKPTDGGPLDIVAYSMGGLVTRVALNTLQGQGSARAAFPYVNLRTVDTPWDGYRHEAAFFRGPVNEMVTRTIMALAGRSGYADMRGSSAMFEGIYATQLRGVSIGNTAAIDPTGRPGTARNLRELDTASLGALADYLLQGTLPSEPRLRNFANALQQDVRAPALTARLRAAPATQSKAEALLAAYDAVMPRIAGDHVSILTDDSNGFVNRLVSELTDTNALTR